MIELWSSSDILNDIQFKLDEYVGNGAKLGFLICPPQSVPGDLQLDLTASANKATYCLLK